MLTDSSDYCDLVSSYHFSPSIHSWVTHALYLFPLLQPQVVSFALTQRRASTSVRTAKDIDEAIVGYTRKLGSFLSHFQSQGAGIFDLVVEEATSGAPGLSAVRSPDQHVDSVLDLNYSHKGFQANAEGDGGLPYFPSRSIVKHQGRIDIVAEEYLLLA